MGVGWLAVHYINKILNCHFFYLSRFFLFVHKHCNLERCMADWDDIWHKHMGFKHVLPINLPFLFVHNTWYLENQKSD